jgi:hypothetical protein
VLEFGELLVRLGADWRTNGGAVGTGGSKGISGPVEIAETKGLSLSQD